MKRKTTREILVESFRELAARKDVNKITISDIVRNCDMSPATFYRYFRDKFDLIAWLYNQRCNEIFQKQKSEPRDQKELAIEWIRLCEANRDFLLNLMNNTGGYDSFLHSMALTHARIIEEDIIAHSGEDVLTEKILLRVYLHASGVTRLMFAWLQGAIPATAEDFAEAIVETQPPSVIALITPRKIRRIKRSLSK